MSDANFFVANGITGLGIFLGIVAGALVQFLLHYAVSFKQRQNARKILLVELRHNQIQVGRVKAVFEQLMSRSAHITADEVYVDMRLFNYRGADLLLNQGYFHDSLSSQKLEQYFDFMSKFNSDLAKNLRDALIRDLEKEDRNSFDQLCVALVNECTSAHSNLDEMIKSIS